jgi:hypothetical protein
MRAKSLDPEGFYEWDFAGFPEDFIDENPMIKVNTGKFFYIQIKLKISYHN